MHLYGTLKNQPKSELGALLTTMSNLLGQSQTLNKGQRICQTSYFWCAQFLAIAFERPLSVSRVLV